MVSPSQDPTAPRIDPSGVDSPGGDGHHRQPVTDDQTPQAHLKAAQRRFEELKEYVSYLVAAKIDATKASLRNVGIYAALGIVGLMALSALVVTAVVLVCNGLAGGLAAMFGHRPWLGNLVAGIVLLGVIAGVAWFGMKKVTGASKERTLKKYAARQQQQRARFGEDVAQAARNPAN